MLKGTGELVYYLLFYHTQRLRASLRLLPSSKILDGEREFLQDGSELYIHLKI